MNSGGKKNVADGPSIDALITALNSKDGLARQRARNALVAIGEPALDALIEAFENKDEDTHWEVAKALSRIGTGKAAKPLVEALEDKEFSIRWIAAEGLIHIGHDGLEPLLQALKDRPGSVWLREGAHHVLHDLIQRKLIDDQTIAHVSPLLDALNHRDPEMQTVAASAEAFAALKNV